MIEMNELSSSFAFVDAVGKELWHYDFRSDVRSAIISWDDVVTTVRE